MVDALAKWVQGDATDGARNVAMAPEGPLSRDLFIRDVLWWEQQLATLPGRFIAIHQAHPGKFLSCLLAVWRLGKIGVISANGFRDLAHAMATQPRDQQDFAVEFNASSLSTPIAEHRDAALILFTSGSSGAPQAIAKSLAQLDAELALLDSLWGESLAGTLVVNMVSHHHMFGLPFGLLWPLAKGVMFYTRTVHYPETLEHLAQGHRLTLVCSPVHLERLPDPLHTTQLAGRIGRVFSAGAPLTAVAASHCQRYFGVPATEIYGSSETGAVAWREQLTTSLWQCLPGVVVDNSRGSRQLCIHSPALADDQGLEVSDLGEVHSPTTFSLGGRVDRIAKVGGKRVSLTALETALASHHWVRVARVVPLSARKNRLGAVIVLEKDGNEALIDRGRRVINSQLRDHIAGPLEPIALPRYWRYVAKLPVNSQGKTTLDALVDLFVEERQSRYPVMIDSEELAPASHYRLHLQIPANLYYFNGHFPGRPVLPGVVQTHWAIHFARELFPDLGEFAGLEAIKFQHIIQPDALVSLDLQWQSVRNKLLFSYQSTHACHSSGRVLFSNGAGQ